ncbi:MAG: hypothetical protein ACT4PW_00730 [Acidimicrobiia bacterium]
MVVTVVPDVAGLEGKRFDYLVPDELRDQVRVGTQVRVVLAGRRARAWVTAVDVEPPPGVTLRPIAKVTGWGPAADVVALAEWAAWRWAGRLVHLLDAASPPGAVPCLPSPPAAGARPAPGPHDGARLEWFQAAGVTVVEVAPADDPLTLAGAAASTGAALVLAPSVDTAQRLASGLREAGVATALVPRDWAQAAAGGRVVVGARGAAWAPVPGLSAVLVLDESDEGYREGRAPTWHARDVVVERARRAGVPCVLASPAPSLAAAALAGPRRLPAARRRAGWPVLDIVDRRREDPRTAGLLSARLATLVRDPARGRALCVLNRTGRARLLACAACGEVARCVACRAAVGMPADEPSRLRCPRCRAERPVVCAACGSSRLRNLRAGTRRVAEELAALAGEPVGEVVAKEARSGDARILIGTEAVLHQVAPPIGVVAYLDFDQELLAPRYAAAEAALALLVRGARLVGPRADGGRLLVQTRVPRHPVLDAVLHADPGRLVAPEAEARQALRFPPAAALAEISGAAAELFVAGLAGVPGIDLLGPADGRWLVRADGHRALGDALAAVPRPPGRLRIAVDPDRV